MATFGCTTIGTFLPNQSFVNEITGGAFYCPDDGSAESITAYLRFAVGRSKCAIYDSAANFVAGTEEFDAGGVLTEGWHTYNFPVRPLLYGGRNYYLVIWGNKPDTWNHLAREIGFPGEQKSQLVAYDGWPATYAPGEWGARLSIYCTYTPAPVISPPSLTTVITLPATGVT